MYCFSTQYDLVLYLKLTVSVIPLTLFNLYHTIVNSVYRTSPDWLRAGACRKSRQWQRMVGQGRKWTGWWCRRCCLEFGFSSQQSKWCRAPRGRICSSQAAEARSRPPSTARRSRSLPALGGSLCRWLWWAPSWCCNAHKTELPGRSGRRCLREMEKKYME